MLSPGRPAAGRKDVKVSMLISMGAESTKTRRYASKRGISSSLRQRSRASGLKNTVPAARISIPAAKPTVSDAVRLLPAVSLSLPPRATAYTVDPPLPSREYTAAIRSIIGIPRLTTAIASLPSIFDTSILSRNSFSDSAA